MNFLIGVGILLGVAAIVVSLSLYFARDKRGTDTFTEAMRGFHGGKLKGGSGVMNFFDNAFNFLGPLFLIGTVVYILYLTAVNHLI